MNCDKLCIAGNLVIFSQSPADIQYVISLYESYHRKCQIIIVVVGMESNYHFLKSLNLKDANLYFINTTIYRLKAFNLWIMRRNLYQLYCQLTALGNLTICFFSNYFDYYTFYLVSKLVGQHQVYMIDVYNMDRELALNIGLTGKIKLWLLRTIFKIELYYTYSPDDLVITLPIESYNITRLYCRPDYNAIQRYSYRVDGLGANDILLLESGPGPGMEVTSYYNILKLIVEMLIKNGYKIYVKPHPRLGHSAILDQFNVVVLPGYLPSEFIDARKFTFVIGDYSIGLATFGKQAERAPVCIGGMFRFYKESDKELYRNYLVNIDGGDKIIFTDELVELEDLVFRLETKIISRAPSYQGDSE